jgi:hypothetical protein
VTETCCDYRENRTEYCVRRNYIVYLHLIHNMELKYKFKSLIDPYAHLSLAFIHTRGTPHITKIKQKN